MGSHCGLGHVSTDVFLNCILSHINCKRDLAALIATSTAFRDLATPKLYADYVNVADVVEPKKPFTLFLRTIATRPELARHCKSLEVREFSTEILAGRDDMEYWKWHPWGPLDKLDRRVFATAAMEMGVISQYDGSSRDVADKQFLRGLYAGHEDAQLILIIACLPNLEKVILRGFPCPSFRSMPWNTFLSRIKHGFSRLAEFSAGQYNDRAGVDVGVWTFDELDFLLQLPRFRKFHGEGAHIKRDNPLWDSLPATFPITELRLHNCEVGNRAATALIRSCIALEIFEYSRNCQAYIPAGEFEDLDAEDIGEALLQQKHSLRTLYLDFCDYEEWDENHSDWIGSLKEFVKLTRLHLDYPRLVGIGTESGKRNLSTVLPTAIQVLSLDYAIDDEWGHGIRSDLVHLAHSRLLVCPNLTTVALVLPDSDGKIESRGAEWMNIKSIFESRGLALRPCDWEREIRPLFRDVCDLDAQAAQLGEIEEWKWRYGRWPYSSRCW